MTSASSPLRVLIHAPTAASLARARSNALNIVRDMPDADVRIVVNADAVKAALDAPHEQADKWLWICQNTLRKMALDAPAGVKTVPSAALALAVLQTEGWTYIRA